ncbi:MAG: LPXTG cell wall anchor domain-containing protein, partial [Ruminococcaceae bacterium]|nr:LPXTG cell wall anchor domain-containing protein [Oscillospiraceae bacterium]
LYELPDYTYSVVEGYGDCEYFEVKDNGIYLKKDHADSGKSEYNIKVSAVSGTEAYYTTMTIDVLTKSKSKNQLYPELTLSETKENTDTTVQTVPSDPGEGENDPETPVEGDKGDSNVIVFVVIGAVIIIIAVAAVILIGKKKK